MTESGRELENSDEQLGLDPELRPKSSWAQVASTLVQAGLLGVALYGLFISSLGDRLVEVLQGDISSAKDELAQLEQDASLAESRLISRQTELERLRQNFLLSRVELFRQEEELEEAIVKTRSIEANLTDANLRLSQLSDALDVARPALKNQRCRGIISQLTVPRALEMRYRILPVYRWISFRSQAQRADLQSYETLKTAFLGWIEERAKDDPDTQQIFRFVDQSILLEIDSQRHWSTFNSEREEEILRGLKVSDPRNFAFKPRDYRSDIRNLEDFLILDEELSATSRYLETLIERERVEGIDPEYAEFKRELREKITPVLPVFGSYIGEREASSATTDDEITRLALRQLRFETTFRNVRSHVADICGIENPIDRLFFGI